MQRLQTRTRIMNNNDKDKAGLELMRALDTLERERGIPQEVAFTAIERAIRLAIGRHSGGDDDVDVQIDRQRGLITVRKGDQEIDPYSGELGRLAAQAAKQQMIQLFREEESGWHRPCFRGRGIEVCARVACE
jgi:hypothetical protein